MLEQLARASLFALAAALPFELADPLIGLGPFAVTSVELLLYLVLASWGRLVLRRRVSGWSGACAALAFFAATVVLSALFAEMHRTAALKFAGRLLGGCLLAVATAHLVREAPQRAALVTALAVGAAASALLGLAEMWWPAANDWLLRFKTQPSFVGGWQRASGPFQYANIAAMYWEAALPIVLIVGVARATARRRRTPLVIATLVALVVAEAIVLSASRAGWWGAIGMMGLLMATGWRRLPTVRIPSLVVLAALLAFPVVGASVGGLAARRLSAGDPRAWYAVEYRHVPATLSVPAGGETTTTLSVRNAGMLTWPVGGERPVSLSYHWFDETGDWVVVFEGARSPLPRTVRPGEAVNVEARVFGAVPPGRYRLKWDLVHEHVTWFSALGAPMAETRVTVHSRAHALKLPELPRPFHYAPVVRPPRRELWRAALTLWRSRPLLGIGPDNFRRVWGPYVPAATFDDRIHANSLYFELLVTLGLGGLAAFLIVVGAVAWTMTRWVMTAETREAVAVAMGVGAAFAAFLVHGFVDYFLPFTPTYGFFWMLVGLALGRPRSGPLDGGADSRGRVDASGSIAT